MRDIGLGAFLFGAVFGVTVTGTVLWEPRFDAGVRVGLELARPCDTKGEFQTVRIGPDGWVCAFGHWRRVIAAGDQ